MQGFIALCSNTPLNQRQDADVLLNNAGASIDATVNKHVVAKDASLNFKTGFLARALFGTLGSDDFTLAVAAAAARVLLTLSMGVTEWFGIRHSRLRRCRLGQRRPRPI